MTTWLAVMGAALAGLAALEAVRPARGAADRMLRAIGGGALLILAAVATASGAYAGAAIAGAVALPLLLAPALPWAFSRLAMRDPE